MRRSAMLLSILAVFSTLALAESFQGRLVDASCYGQQKSATTCDPSSTTSEFTLIVSDQPYKLDAAGNSKATEALKNRADRSKDPTKPLTNNAVMANITGEKGPDNVLKVEAIVVQ